MFGSVLARHLHGFRIRLARSQSLRGNVDCAALSEALSDWSRSLIDPTGYYLDCFRFFQRCAPEFLREHRAYFSRERRGFGEDAFHVMWWMLSLRITLLHFLEIGVYRGQVLSLASLLVGEKVKDGILCGISPFEAAGDSVSKYPHSLDYLSDTRENFKHFGLAEPVLIREYSTDPIAVRTIRSRQWDCIYIDGSHDYPVVEADWQHCSEAIRPGGLIVLDDSALATSYRPPPFATKGHPGPSEVAESIDRSQFQEILQVGHNRVFQRRVEVDGEKTPLRMAEVHPRK